MLTKEYIVELKNKGDKALASTLAEQTDVGSINYILEHIGQLPSSFQPSVFLNLLTHTNAKVRLNAVKNIGKLKNVSITNELIDFYDKETDTNVKREIISALGRQRNPTLTSFFVQILDHEDPKIVLQAIRSLWAVDRSERTSEKLKSFINHPNEMIKSVVYAHYFDKQDATEEELPHTDTYDFLKNVVVHGDVLDVLKEVPKGSFHLTFTSPPYYNARDYSIYPSYEAYLDFLENVFIETHRVTKTGRFLIVNTSPIIIPRISRAHSSKRYGIPFDLHARITRNGWEFIDDIVWVKPESSVKNRVGGFMQHRKPLGYKPNAITEYLMVYRKQTSKLLDWNIRKYPYETVTESRITGDFETNNVWSIDPTYDKTHSAVFPGKLCKRVIQYYSYTGDIIFDPFGGSGTLGRIAKDLNRLFFMTEQNPLYFDYMQKKIRPSSIFPNSPTQFMKLEEFKNVD